MRNYKDDYENLILELNLLLSDITKLSNLHFDKSQADKSPELLAFHKGKSYAYDVCKERLSEILDS